MRKLSTFLREYLRDSGLLVLASVLFGLLVWLTLPGAVVVCDDDFSYLRSVAETIRRGRPWTDDWLNPWAAASSCLSAIIFKLTGSFRLAIHATLVLAASATFLGMATFIRNQKFDPFLAIGTTAMVLASPVVFFMSLMYTSVPVYTACLWFCLWMSCKRQWLAFFVFWIVGVCSRQSAIVWLALPATLCLQEMWLHRSVFPRRVTFVLPLATGCLGLLAFIGIKALMNPTTGQAVVIQTLKSGFIARDALVPLGAGILALTAGYGISCLLSYFRGGASVTRHAHPGGNLPRLAGLVLAGIVGACAGMWVQKNLSFTHWSQIMDNRDPLMILVGCLAGCGIALHPVRPRWHYFVPALGVIALLCLYSGTFDYYFTEVFCYGLVSGLRPPALAPDAVLQPSRIRRAGALLVAAIMTICLGRTCLCLKIQQDYALATIQIHEAALRRGILKPHQIGFTTFGYLGWQWEPYYRMTQGYRSTKDLANFRVWKEPWHGNHGTGMVIQYPRFLASSRLAKNLLPMKNPRSFKGKPDVVDLIDSHARFLWIFDNKIVLKRGGSQPQDRSMIPVDYTKYHREPFPLDDAEWDSYIRRQGLWSTRL